MLKNKLLTSVFIFFIFCMSALFFMIPKQSFSVNEKRTLEEPPSFSVGSLLEGDFEKDTENYLTDHFPFRDKWVAMNAYYLLYTGRNGVNGVYKGRDGYILNTPVKADYEMLEQNLGAMLALREKTQILSKLIVVPTAGWLMSRELPPFSMEYPDEELIQYIKETTEKEIGWIDVPERLKKLSENNEGYSSSEITDEAENESKLYYKTDHHWTTKASYEAYVEYCKTEGFEPLWDFDVKSYDGFYGTTYSKSALWGEQGDTIEIWNYPHDVSVTIENEREYNDMFFYDHLKENDKYPVFLDGNHGIEHIVNNDSEDSGRLLVIKDSYAHSLIPFLINHFREIDMIDPRYYFSPVSELADEREYDEILFVFGISNLCESNDLAIVE